MPANETYIVEVFSSIQGEGLTCGERQIFVRFALCNLTCDYCDTPDSRLQPAKCLIEKASGLGDMREEPNPVSVARLVDAVRSLNVPPGVHHSVSLTGGEPLLHAEFLRHFLTANRANGIRCQLETNGTLPERLGEVIEEIDFVSMDIKLRSATGAESPWDAHLRFLEIAQRKPVWVKVVVSAATTPGEIGEAAALVSAVNPGIPMIIQPVTPRGGVKGPEGRLLISLQEEARRRLHTVRVIPQMHIMLGLK
jgi:organic radical activating enzyme